ncbi:hypothetical protein ES705_49804 [subsurface metagenome]
MHKVSIKKSAFKEFKKIPPNIRENIKEVIYSLRENPLPVGCKKLKIYENCYRVRKGQYRVIYEIKGKDSIVVIKIGHRKAVY